MLRSVGRLSTWVLLILRWARFGFEICDFAACSIRWVALAQRFVDLSLWLYPVRNIGFGRWLLFFLLRQWCFAFWSWDGAEEVGLGSFLRLLVVRKFYFDWLYILFSLRRIELLAGNWRSAVWTYLRQRSQRRRWLDSVRCSFAVVIWIHHWRRTWSQVLLVYRTDHIYLVFNILRRLWLILCWIQWFVAKGNRDLIGWCRNRELRWIISGTGIITWPVLTWNASFVITVWKWWIISLCTVEPFQVSQSLICKLVWARAQHAVSCWKYVIFGFLGHVWHLYQRLASILDPMHWFGYNLLRP